MSPAQQQPATATATAKASKPKPKRTISDVVLKVYPTIASLLKPFSHFNYDDCSVDELEAFIRDRKLSMAQYKKAAKKSNLVRRLTLADQTPSFDFFALVPEIRNNIYALLLTMQGDARKTSCNPQILATCKRARSEATGILYAHNRLSISIPKKDAEGEAKWKRLPHLDFPQYLRRIAHLTIYSNQDVSKNWWEPERCSTGYRIWDFLTQLGDFMQHGNALESLVVHLDQDRIGDETALRKFVHVVYHFAPAGGKFALVHDAMPEAEVRRVQDDVDLLARFQRFQQGDPARVDFFETYKARIPKREVIDLVKKYGLPFNNAGKGIAFDMMLDEFCKEMGAKEGEEPAVLEDLKQSVDRRLDVMALAEVCYAMKPI